MDSNELARGWGDRQSCPFECGERTDILLDGRVVLFLKCNGALHRNKGRPDIWDVSVLVCPFRPS